MLLFLTMAWLVAPFFEMFGPLLFVWPAWLALGCYLIACVATRRPLGPALARTALVPAAFVLVVMFVLSGAADALQLRVSEGALRRAGAAALRGEEPRRAGTYRIRRVRVFEGCAYLATDEFIFDEYGFAYCSEGGSPNATWSRWLGGGLWEYEVIT